MQQKKLMQSMENRTYQAKQELVRRTIISERSDELHNLLDEEKPDAEPPIPLANLEAEAETELQAWQEARNESAGGAETSRNMRDEKSTPKSMFRPKPWMKLK